VSESCTVLVLVFRYADCVVSRSSFVNAKTGVFRVVGAFFTWDR
jgi:hypothetical protein